MALLKVCGVLLLDQSFEVADQAPALLDHLKHSLGPKLKGLCKKEEFLSALFRDLFL